MVPIMIDHVDNLTSGGGFCYDAPQRPSTVGNRPISFIGSNKGDSEAFSSSISSDSHSTLDFYYMLLAP
jgi:hypothetical protein